MLNLAKMRDQTVQEIDRIETELCISRRHQLQSINDYRKTVQKKIKQEQNEPMEEAHVSGLKEFQGEDRGYDHRKKLQAKQMKAWYHQHLQAKDQQKKDQEAEEEAFRIYQLKINEKIKQLEESHRLAKETLLKHVKETNQKLVMIS